VEHQTFVGAKLQFAEGSFQAMDNALRRARGTGRAKSDTYSALGKHGGGNSKIYLLALQQETLAA
jgi:hypothetical protein